MVNHTQTIRRHNSRIAWVFDHFVELALKELNSITPSISSNSISLTGMNDLVLMNESIRWQSHFLGK